MKKSEIQDYDGKKTCQGIRSSWPWKGYPCGNKAKYKVGKKVFCYAHVSQELKKLNQKIIK